MEIQERNIPAAAPILGGQHNAEKTYIYFINETHRSVLIYWLSFKGQEEFYFTLKPGGGVKVDTYVNHCWLFRVKETGERLHVMNKNVFLSQLYGIRDPHNESQWLRVRKIVSIHLPKKSLRYICLWKCAEIIYNLCYNYNPVENLLIPQSIKKDLRQILNIIEKHNAQQTRRTER